VQFEIIKLNEKRFTLSLSDDRLLSDLYNIRNIYNFLNLEFGKAQSDLDIYLQEIIESYGGKLETCFPIGLHYNLIDVVNKLDLLEELNSFLIIEKLTS